MKIDGLLVTNQCITSNHQWSGGVGVVILFHCCGSVLTLRNCSPLYTTALHWLSLDFISTHYTEHSAKHSLVIFVHRIPSYWWVHAGYFVSEPTMYSPHTQWVNRGLPPVIGGVRGPRFESSPGPMTKSGLYDR